MVKILIMTKVDRETLSKLPPGWFLSRELSFAIKNKDYRCERLFALGQIDRRNIGNGMEYRRYERMAQID